MIRKLDLEQRRSAYAAFLKVRLDGPGFVLLLAFLGGAIIFVLWPYL